MKSLRIRQISIWMLNLIIILGISSCEDNGNLHIAYGNFETEDWRISAEIPGKLLTFDVEEGKELQEGQLVGILDSSSLFLKKQQLKATINAIYAKKQNAEPQVKLLKKKKAVLFTEKKRLTSLLRDSLVNQKQMDDLIAQEEVLDAQITMARENVSLANTGILAQVNPLKAQIAEIDNQISKCFIKSPVKGIVTLKIAQKDEMVSPGMVLCKLAPMDPIILRAYITGNQLPKIKLNQAIEVKADNGNGDTNSYTGKISWIANEAEFTPKIIQTAEDRVNLVYAIKIMVPNDGSLKAGMPGELHFEEEAANNQK